MFRNMRRVKNEISVEEAKELLKKNRRAALSVHGDGGYPYTIPIKTAPAKNSMVISVKNQSPKGTM